MKLSLNWLKEYVDINIPYTELENKFNLMSQEVSGLEKLIDATNLVIGYVLTCEKHPDADKLNVCMVDVGTETLQIICGAPNVAKGQKVIVALNGAVLPGDFKIKKAKIRGVESNGMICSLAELGVQDFDPKEKGIYVLGDDAKIGQDPLEYLHLDDYVLDLDLTANRADLLSYLGAAYDTACLIDEKTKIKEPSVKREKGEENIDVFTQTNNCCAYYGQIIKNVKIKPSPAWLKSRLIASGIRPINNVVDITNYVMLEYGQPLHAFDYDKINSNQIIVRMAKKGEKIFTLDEQERKLLETDIVITDGKKPIALAGVMGGLETEIDDNTKKILLESAIFNPISVRKTSKRLDLKSESSTRFERGVVPSWTIKAMDRACELFVELADATVVNNPSFFNSCNNDELEIELTLNKLNSVTGYEFSKEDVEDILRRLQFDFNIKEHQRFIITVPDRRLNFFTYQDIIEEIVRIHGYDRIPVSMPDIPTQGSLTDKQRLRREIRNYFVDRGFSETKTYSLVSESVAKEYDIENKSLVKIMNPLAVEKQFLRHSLIPSLLNVLVYNKSRKVEDINIFEIGKSYTQEKETELLSGLIYGKVDYSLWQGDDRKVDFYLLKGLLDSLFKKLNIENLRYETSKHKLENIHPGIHADLYIKDKYIGFVGRLHPQKEQELNINDTFIFELNLDIIAESINTDIVYKEIPKYPSVKRDLAIVMDKEIPADKLLEEVRKAGKKTLINVEIFDVYEDDKALKEEKSVALSLEMQNTEKTLEAQDVELVIDRILKHLNNTLNARLR